MMAILSKNIGASKNIGVQWDLRILATVQLVALLMVMNQFVSIVLSAEWIERSVQETRGRWLDELDLPHQTRRESRLGWEIRSTPFVVFAKTSPEDARLAAEQAHSAWQEMGKLADRFTDVQRRPSFAVGNVLIYIDNARVTGNNRPASSLRGQRESSMVYVNVSSDGSPLADQVKGLRLSTSQAFLQVSELDQRLPQWVQTGLAHYAADQIDPPAGPDFSIDLTRFPVVRERPYVEHRVAPSRLSTPPGMDPASIAWVRFLVDADDGEHVGSFFRSLRTTVDSFDSRIHRPLTHRGSPRRPRAVWSSADTYVRRPGLQSAMLDWVEGEDTDEMVVDGLPEAKVDPELAAVQQEMLLIVDLLQRFSPRSWSRPGSKVISFGVDEPSQTQGFTTARDQFGMEELYLHLIRGSAGEWSARDIDGSLLDASRKNRLRELLGIEQDKYTLSKVEGRNVLEHRWNRTDVVQVWLEEDSSDSKRVIGRVRLVPTDEPAQEEGENTPDADESAAITDAGQIWRGANGNGVPWPDAYSPSNVPSTPLSLEPRRARR